MLVSLSLALVATKVNTLDDASIGLPTARLPPGVLVPVRVTVFDAAEVLPAASRALT